MSKIELDVAVESPAELGELTQGFDVTATVLQDPGPAAGWPVVRFEGDRIELMRLVAVQFAQDVIEFREMIEEITD